MSLLMTFLELDKINESYDAFGDRNELIAKIKATGRKYDFSKYSNEQLYRIWQRLEADIATTHTHSTFTKDSSTVCEYQSCPECGTTLTDGGFCPQCDDGYDTEYTESLVEGIFRDLFKKRTKYEPIDDMPITTDMSTEHAVIATADQIKAIYEAGLFDQAPVGRKNAVSASIYGIDKQRLAGYFKKQPEFEYEMNCEDNIISHEFVSDTLDIEIFDDFMTVYRLA